MINLNYHHKAKHWLLLICLQVQIPFKFCSVCRPIDSACPACSACAVCSVWLVHSCLATLKANFTTYRALLNWQISYSAPRFTFYLHWLKINTNFLKLLDVTQRTEVETVETIIFTLKGTTSEVCISTPNNANNTELHRN